MSKRTTASILAFFLGGIGVHKFYQGKIGMGILYLLMFWTMIPMIIAFIEFIIYITMSDEKYELKYHSKIKFNQIEDIKKELESIKKEVSKKKTAKKTTKKNKK